MHPRFFTGKLRGRKPHPVLPQGQRNLLGMLSISYYNPKMGLYISDLTARCHLCMLCQPDTQRKGSIDAFRVCDHPNEVWGMDYFKMNESREGYNLS